MMRRSGMTVLLAALLSIAGCSGGEEAQGTADDGAAQEAQDPDHVWKEQVETIDRARDVEKTLKEADEAKRKAIEDAGGG